MGSYLKKLKLFSIIIVGVFLLVSCGSDVKTDSPSQNQGNNNPTNSSNIYADITENLKTYAERKLIYPITAPFEMDGYTQIEIIKNFNNSYNKYYPLKDKQIQYYPKAGFIGSDSLIIKIQDSNDIKKSIQITYNVEIQEQPLDGFRDFIVTFYCDLKSQHYGNRKSIDLDIVNDNIGRIIKVHDDLTRTAQIPNVSKIQLDYFNATTEESVVSHHALFKENLENNLLLTCNYRNGYASILFPLSSEKWKATKPMHNNGYAGVNYDFVRNDLYFHISSLSDLHSKIYQKEYQKHNDLNMAFKIANDFMNKVFPTAHYTAELTSKYSDSKDYLYKLNAILNKDNQRYYTMLQYLADEVTNGSVTVLLEQIAENYESYYISSDKKCLNKTICGALFPEYTVSLTNDPSFKEGLTHWTETKQIDNLSSSGKVEYLPTKEQVSIDFNAHIPTSSSIPIATIALFQRQTIDGNNLDNYFLNFDLVNAYGGGAGFAALAGLKSSGLAGTYVCYKDINNETLGCLTWTDYTNKTKFIWVPTNEGLSFDFYRLHSNDTFFNTELKETFRRIAPPKERMLYITNLGEFTAKNLPKVYDQKSQIYSIEYGIFVSEFRSNSDNSCYNCEGKVTAHKIELLKVK